MELVNPVLLLLGKCCHRRDCQPFVGMKSSCWQLLLQRDVPGLTRAAVPVLANPGWQIGLEVCAHNIARAPAT